MTLIGCIDNGPEIDSSISRKYQEIKNLPASNIEKVELTGVMTWWFWEGDGGCFGTLTDGRKNIELHAEADLCEPIEYEEGAEAIVSVVYEPNKQYVSGKKMYSIIEFVK